MALNQYVTIINIIIIFKIIAIIIIIINSRYPRVWDFPQ